jgi:hypothetical protein
MQGCPVSKETQYRDKRDLLGRKRDLLNSGIPEGNEDKDEHQRPAPKVTKVDSEVL